MLPRRIALLSCVAVIGASAMSASAEADALADACASASPSASACIGGQKVRGAAGAVVPDAERDAALAAYQDSWLHRTAQWQFALGDTVALRDAQWLGTHNSFNAPVYGPTPSRIDSNQVLTLTQQLDADIRSLELDVHFTGGEPKVCHGRGAAELHAGCTLEGPLEPVLAEIAAWLDAHEDQVLLLYLEDHLGEQGYASGLAAIDSALGDRVLKAGAPAGSFRELPLGLTRRDVLEAGASVLLVGRGRPGWGSHVFGWDETHEESGDSTGYACAGPNPKLVRFFEDSTWLSATIDPTQTPADHRAGSLTPDKVKAMTACGVNLLGLDQFEPGDGRVEATIWSWAPEEPAAGNRCAFLRASDGRWVSSPCSGTRPVACRTATGWVLTPPAAMAAADALCAARGGSFDPPRTGEENAALHARAGVAEPWLASS